MLNYSNSVDRLSIELRSPEKAAIIGWLSRQGGSAQEVSEGTGLPILVTMRHLHDLKRKRMVGRRRGVRGDTFFLRARQTGDSPIPRLPPDFWSDRLERLADYLDETSAMETNMSKHSIEHASFSLERIFKVPPSAVFAAWADKSAKAKWFGASIENGGVYELDFEVGGKEISRASAPDSHVYEFRSVYQDIVPNERIVYSYDMLKDGDRISVSLATIEFKPEGSGTRLVLTEHGAFLDGLDDPQLREQGTNWIMDQLVKHVAAAAV